MIGFIAARYKFASKMLANVDTALEVGCERLKAQVDDAWPLGEQRRHEVGPARHATLRAAAVIAGSPAAR